MSYLLEIKNTLNKIANKHGLSGVSVDLAVDLLSQALYYSKSDSLSLINKNSIDTTNNMNSMIQYALTNLYPVFRGQNAIIRVKGFFKSGTVSYKRGDKVFSSKQFNLYLSRDLTPGIDDTVILGDLKYYENELSSSNRDIEPITVDLIVARNFIPDTEFDRNNQAYYVESTVAKDVSEDVFIKRKPENQNNKEDLEFTKLPGDHIDRIQLIKDEFANPTNEVINPLALLLTSYNYSIRLYPCETAPKTINGTTITKLVPNQGHYKYYYNYFPYYEFNPSFEDVKNLSIEGFQIISRQLKVDDSNNPVYDESGNKIWLDQSEFNSEGIDLIKFVERESINDGLPYKVKINLVQAQKMRSLYDITDSFNKYFEQYCINSSYSISGTVDSVKLKITYIPKDPGVLIPNTSSSGVDWTKFKKNELYYLPVEFDDLEAAKYCELGLNIIIYSKLPVSIDEVNKALDEYNYKTNCTITYEELQSKVNRVTNVAYSSLSIHKQIQGGSSSQIIPSGNGVTNVVTEDELGNNYVKIVASISNQLIDEVNSPR